MESGEKKGGDITVDKEWERNMQKGICRLSALQIDIRIDRQKDRQIDRDRLRER